MKKRQLSEKELPQIIRPKKMHRKSMPEVADDADMKSFRRKWAIITMILENDEGYTIEELADHFGVSPRTIRRDLGIFDVVFGGFDTVNEKWGKKRFSLERVPFGDKNSGLSREELVAFCIAQRLMEPLKGTAFGDSMKSGCDKIRDWLKDSTVEQADKIASFFYRSEYRRPHNRKTGQVINEILKAMMTSHALKLRYFSAKDGEDKTYSVLPYTFLYHEGFFYLVGFSRKDSDVRLWKMNRIRAVRLIDTRFVPPETFDIRKYVDGTISPYIGENPPVRVQVRFAPSVVTYVLEQNLSEIKKQTKNENGSLDVEMKVSPGKEFLSWILSFGATAEVLGPKEVRESVAAEVKALKASYSFLA